jgi:hypothetical protein
MDRNELLEKLLKLSKIAIIAGFGETCFFNAETVYRAALQAEAETVFAMYKTASGKALEYTKLAEARALKEAYGSARAALDAAGKAHKLAETHYRRWKRLYKEIDKTFGID